MYQRGNWHVIMIEKSHEQIKTSSVREGIIKRNRLIIHIFIGTIIYLSFMAVNMLALIIPTQFLDVLVTVVESPLWILTYTVLGMSIALYLLAIYSIGKLYKTKKKLINEKQTKPQSGNQKEEKLRKQQEKDLKRSGKLVVKRKFGWMYAPDKLEEWLEKMEQKGFNLHRVS
ncbi:hypothetical protein ACOI1C_19035 [Bacillus sp. DJP31]|uniref:hypothetical protein n=1 Tax=Bacillus sp. DJP31 TaxID=3409789 RepID=UPI003BB4FF37